MTALDDIAAERRRQIEVEGFDAARDDQLDSGELALAAALYALPRDAMLAGEPLLKQDDFIGLDMALELACDFTLKPEPRKRNRLVKAAALIVAEIDRLDRLAAGQGGSDAG